MRDCVLVTGASGGIGFEICIELLSNKENVIGIFHNNENALNDLTKNYPDSFSSYKSNLQSFEETDKLVNEILNDGHTVKALVNCAGISVVGLIQDLGEDEWISLWNTNVTSALGLSKAIIPHFLSQSTVADYSNYDSKDVASNFNMNNSVDGINAGSSDYNNGTVPGRIINIGSVWGEHGASCEVAYSATKGALSAMTKALAKELAPSSIPVNCVSCGIIDTKMNAHLSAEDIKDIEREIPAGRIGTPSDIALVVSQLLNAPSYMTGQIITVDGGWTV